MAVLALAGVTASLFVRRRRAWVRVARDDEGRTVVQVAGLARGDDPGLAAEIEELAGAVLAAVVPAAAGPVAGPTTPAGRQAAGGEAKSMARKG